jgi:hypothetical protein
MVAFSVEFQMLPEIRRSASLVTKGREKIPCSEVPNL